MDAMGARLVSRETLAGLSMAQGRQASSFDAPPVPGVRFAISKNPPAGPPEPALAAHGGSATSAA